MSYWDVCYSLYATLGWKILSKTNVREAKKANRQAREARKKALQK
uniref:Uncharacterized protein n=1 Tax=Vitis vinifera TaxID=29760 RepID=F6HAK3_VITVI